MENGKDYLLFADAGQVVVTSNLASSINDGDEVEISYTHFPLWESKRLNFEESNPVIDGIKLYAQDNVLELNRQKPNGKLVARETIRPPYCLITDLFQI